MIPTVKTSAQWWANMKSDTVKFNDWLQRQYRGEVSAAKRLRKVIDLFKKQGISFTDEAILTKIMKDEAKHASWVKKLLVARGIQPNMDAEHAEDRYWSVQDLTFANFNKTMAVGAHAEKMRLERIECIANDPDSPKDVRETFFNILTDELYHESAFRQMAGAEAMAQTLPDHEAGRRLLGLEA